MKASWSVHPTFAKTGNEIVAFVGPAIATVQGPPLPFLAAANGSEGVHFESSRL